MGRLLTGLAMAFMIGACATDNQAAPRPALPNDILDIETHRRIEEERRAAHVAEQAATNESENEEEFDYEAYKAEAAAREASAAAERAAFNATLPSSPEGMHTWVLESVNFASCGLQTVIAYSTESHDGQTMLDDANVPDEDAECLLLWGEYNEEEDTDRDGKQEVHKPFVVPATITDVDDAVNYLLVTLHHGGVYTRPSVDAVRKQLVAALADGRIPDMEWDLLDAERRNEVYQPIFARSIPNRWGKEFVPSPEFVALQQDIAACSGIRIRVEQRQIYESWVHLLVVEREGVIIAAAAIETFYGYLRPWNIVNGRPQMPD